MAKTEVCRQHTLLWTVGFCSGAVNTVYYSGICVFYLAFKAAWRWGTSPQLWHLRKRPYCRSTSVWLLLSGDPPQDLGQSAKLSWLWWTALGECNRLVCQCLWVIRATGFWSSDSKRRFSSLEQPVCVAMYVLPRSGYCWYSAGGSGPYAKVWRTNATYTTREPSASCCSSQSDSRDHPAAGIILQPRHAAASLLPSGAQTSWIRKSVFSQCFLWDAHIQWLHSRKQRPWWQPAGRQEL